MAYLINPMLFFYSSELFAMDAIFLFKHIFCLKSTWVLGGGGFYLILIW